MKRAEVKVYTGGTFDLFHRGHLSFLKRCSEFGEVTVGLNPDDFIERYKGAPPIMTYEEREAVLEGCRYVEDVVPNSGGENSCEAIELVSPDLLIIGSDWATRDYYSQMGFSQEWLDDRGIALCFLPYTRGISTTIVRSRIKS